jgi:hypothetical protein
MTTIKIKKGAGTPSGLTFGELAYDVTNKKLFIGITGGNALLANTDGGVATFNGLTGAVTGVTVGGTNVFTALNTFNAGISAAGGVTFNTSIQTTRLPRLSSSVFEAKTANWTPTNADDGKIFTVSIGGKSTITCTLDGLSPGVHFKILVITGTVTFSVTGTGSGAAISFGLSAPSSTTVYCTATDTYFATNSA